LAFKKAIFQPFESYYGDDCVIPLDILLQGYKVVQADEAVAYDSFPETAWRELQARIRITLRNITGTLSRYPLLNPLKFPLISVSICFHKICRWLSPFFLLILFFSNLMLMTQGYFYLLTFYCQAAFYSLGLLGLMGELQKKHIPLASPIFGFILANVGFFLGVLKATSGKKVISYSSSVRLID
jgi:cellulose synthase/poly-beta-1,6-N-acetylglucosamine synthase-like glycosyltransferase